MSPTMLANISWAVIVIAATTLTHFGIVPQGITDVIYGLAGYQGAISSYKAVTNGLISIKALQPQQPPTKEN